MKNKLVNIDFEHNGTLFKARVSQFSTTAIFLPNKTVLLTSLVVLTTGDNKLNNLKRVRQIYNGKGELNPLKTLINPGNWDRPKEVHFPIAFAEEQ